MKINNQPSYQQFPKENSFLKTLHNAGQICKAFILKAAFWSAFLQVNRHKLYDLTDIAGQIM